MADFAAVPQALPLAIFGRGRGGKKIPNAFLPLRRLAPCGPDAFSRSEARRDGAVRARHQPVPPLATDVGINPH